MSRIVMSCHSDPTSGHLGVKKTVARISDRFIWHGIVKDVNEFVSKFPKNKKSKNLAMYKD